MPLCFFLIRGNGGESQVSPEYAGVRSVAVAPELDVREVSQSKSVTETRTHEVSEVTAGRVVLLLAPETSEDEVSTIVHRLDATIEPSRSGRTGPEVHFPRGVPLQAALQALHGQGVESAGQLQRFVFHSAHDHNRCGTCLIPNLVALQEHPTVRAVPSFLGDAENTRVDVVVSAPSASNIINILRNDYYPNL